MIILKNLLPLRYPIGPKNITIKKEKTDKGTVNIQGDP